MDTMHVQTPVHQAYKC